MHKIIYTCEGKTERPNKRRWGNPEISKCRKPLSPLKLEGCREKPGHWSPEVGLAGRSQSCGDPVLWDLQPQRSSSCWVEQRRRRINPLPSPFLLTSILLPVPPMDSRKTCRQNRAEKGKEQASEGTRPGTGTLLLGMWQILFSKIGYNNIPGPICFSGTMTLSYQVNFESLSILGGTLQLSSWIE